MSRVPTSFAALTTRIRLAEMLAPTYAGLRNVDLNEAYGRLEEAFALLRLIEGVQLGFWRALTDDSDQDDASVVERVGKRMYKRQRYAAFKPKKKDEGPIAALTILMDEGAGLSSGEAFDLLETEEGQRMLELGFRVIGAHLAKQVG
jgi:hypothetical protein